MKKKTEITDKDFSCFWGVEDETGTNLLHKKRLWFPKQKDQQSNRAQRIPRTLNLHRTLRVQPFKGASVPR